MYSFDFSIVRINLRQVTKILEPIFSMPSKKSIENTFYFALVETSQIIREKINSYLKAKKTNITSNQWFCLFAVFRNQGLTQKTLARQLLKDEASVSRISKKLEEKGFLYRNRNKLDNKSIQLFLSPNGYELVNSHLLDIKNIYKKILAPIHEREMNAMIDILGRIKP